MKQIEAASKRPGQQRTRAAERLEMVERFQRSGLTRKAFAAREGVPRSTLDFWLYVARHRSQSSSLVFREVQISVPAEPAGWAMEIESRDGLRVRLREALGGSELARLLRGTRC
jgi:hypothetical protein